MDASVQIPTMVKVKQPVSSQRQYGEQIPAQKDASHDGKLGHSQSEG